jgi:hypothetical protein
MLRRFYNSVRGYLGGIALALGCFGLLAFVLLIPFVIFSRHFWTGFSPDGPGMSAARREAAISQGLDSDVLHLFIPLFLVSLLLIAYGFYEAHIERKRKR